MKPLSLTVILLLAPLLALAADCPTTADFTGDILIGFTGSQVSLRWTSFETTQIDGYAVMRTPAPATPPASPSSAPGAAQLIADIEPDPDHLWTERRYELADSPPGGTWVYQLRIRYDHRRPCTLETLPLSIPEHPPCGVVDVCDQVGQSFTGGIVISLTTPAVRLKWGSCAEDSTVHGYRLQRRRADCSGSHCWRRRGFIRADGECGQVKLHSFTDEPRTGDYVYRLQVLDDSGRPVCAVEAPPQALP